MKSEIMGKKKKGTDIKTFRVIIQWDAWTNK